MGFQLRVEVVVTLKSIKRETKCNFIQVLLTSNTHILGRQNTVEKYIWMNIFSLCRLVWLSVTLWKLLVKIDVLQVSSLESWKRESDQEKSTPYIPPDQLQLSTNQNAGNSVCEFAICCQHLRPSDHIQDFYFFHEMVQKLS